MEDEEQKKLRARVEARNKRLLNSGASRLNRIQPGLGDEPAQPAAQTATPFLESPGFRRCPEPQESECSESCREFIRFLPTLRFLRSLQLGVCMAVWSLWGGGPSFALVRFAVVAGLLEAASMMSRSAGAGPAVVIASLTALLTAPLDLSYLAGVFAADAAFAVLILWRAPGLFPGLLSAAEWRVRWGTEKVPAASLPWPIVALGRVVSAASAVRARLMEAAVSLAAAAVVCTFHPAAVV
eukprot:Polyplicarium_translucidae@DN1331_c0_g1_i2.p1